MKEKEIPTDLKTRLQIESIHLKSSTAEIYLPPEVAAPKNVSLKFNYVFNEMHDEKYLFSFVGVEATGKLKKENLQKLRNAKDSEIPEDLFYISCVYVIRYNILKGPLSNEDAEVFTRENARFNIHPFLREHLNSISVKMGIHPINLPLLVFNKNESAKPDDDL